MPVHYRYDAASRRLVTRCDGEVRLGDVVSHFRELTTISRLHPNSDVLLDLTFQTNLPPAEKIDSAAGALEEVCALLQLGRCAMVAPDGVPSAIARRFQAVGWPLFSGMRIFETNGDATEWLDRRGG